VSLDKAIKHGKEKRKQYYGAKAVDPSCCNGGDCPICKGNRTHKHKKQKAISDGAIYAAAAEQSIKDEIVKQLIKGKTE
jgi:hypothetical protein